MHPERKIDPEVDLACQMAAAIIGALNDQGIDIMQGFLNGLRASRDGDPDFTWTADAVSLFESSLEEGE